MPLENVVKYHAWEQERACAMLDELKRRHRGDGAMAVILDVAGMTIGRHINKDFIWLACGPCGIQNRATPIEQHKSD